MEQLKTFFALSAALTAFAAAAAPTPEQLDAYASGVREIVPRFAKWGNNENSRIALLDEQGETVGFLLLPPEEKRQRVKGYNGVIDAGALLDADGKRVIGAVVGRNRETPRFLRKVRTSGFLTRWNRLTVEEAAAKKVDAVTGATYSSRAIMAELHDAFAAGAAKTKR